MCARTYSSLCYVIKHMEVSPNFLQTSLLANRLSDIRSHCAHHVKLSLQSITQTSSFSIWPYTYQSRFSRQWRYQLRVKPSSALKLAAVCSSRTVVSTYKSTWINHKTNTGIICAVLQYISVLCLKHIDFITAFERCYYVMQTYHYFCIWKHCNAKISPNEAHDNHVFGVRSRLWTAATNGLTVHPPSDIWAWRIMREWYWPGQFLIRPPEVSHPVAKQE
jgi:hypothetical protein